MKKVEVKILGFNCASRARNTAWLVLYSLKAAEKFGRRVSEIADIKTGFFDMSKRDIDPWPYGDKGFEVAPETDDYFAKKIMPQVRESDGFIFGSAVFNHSFTSRYIRLIERLTEAAWKGYLTSKPAGCISVATMGKGGQDVTLSDMNSSLKGLGLIVVSWGNGVPSVSGPPFGPFAMDDDHKVIAAKKDEQARRLAVLLGRRIAEFAVIQKLAKRKLGNVFTKEFVQIYPRVHSDESWSWWELNKKDYKSSDRG